MDARKKLSLTLIINKIPYNIKEPDRYIKKSK